MVSIRRNFPNLLTCVNIIGGTLAVIAASYGISELWGLHGFQWAFIFMAIGALADFFDGFSARLLHAYSQVGKELDSLCDVVTFGVAPCITLFFLLRDVGTDPWLCWTTILIPVSAAYRLARFNVDSRQTTSFIGLPVPANAIFWIGYAALIWRGVEFLSVWYVFLIFLIVECLLMNSNIQMFSLKMKDYSFKNNIPQYLLVIATAIFCFSLGTSGLFWVIVFYILSSIAFTKKQD